MYNKCMGHYSTSAEMEKYGGEEEKDKDGKVIGPIFGKDFIRAPWNDRLSGYRKGDSWCYLFDRSKGCVDFELRNNRKLAEYLYAESEKAKALQKGSNRYRGGKRRTRRTKRSRKTKRR